ncbi:hypothetical protein C2I36_09100 [Rhodobacteraceae bacterium WD3A24]|nr:hypothetical protein C2I36_09100 [Rhodobacteraceae bacterium WD3A24]
MTHCILRRGGALAVLAVSLSACATIPQDGGPPIVADGIDRGPIEGERLAQMDAGIYVDPDGCHNWVIDDGSEGYLTRRRDPQTGLPVCTDIAEPGSIVGDHGRSAPNVPDIYR